MFNRFFTKEEALKRLKELGVKCETDSLGRKRLFETHRYAIIRNLIKKNKDKVIGPEQAKVVLL